MNNDNNTAATTKQLRTGIAGNGSTSYLVVTVRTVDGSWRHVETFDNEPEALCWIKWS